jgi:hypothetical protein
MERFRCQHCKQDFDSADALARHQREERGANQAQTGAEPDPVQSAPTGGQMTGQSGTQPPRGGGGVTAP